MTTGDDRARDDEADDLLLVGTVARPHGNRGGVIVNLATDFAAERFKVAKCCWWVRWPGRPPACRGGFSRRGFIRGAR
jgi:hypothetical protein